MIDSIISTLTLIDSFFWDYIGVYLILLPGLYFTISTKGFQFRVLANFRKVFSDLGKQAKQKDEPGVNPFKLYFASVGGMIGLGNIVAVVTAITIGGPGAIFWVWISAFAGMLIKYSEIYLGIKYRVRNKKESYDGGSMFYLRKAFTSKSIPMIAAFMLCVYGVEVFQFKVINDALIKTFHFNENIVIGVTLAITLYTALGGIRRLSNICTALMPPFMISYIALGLWIILQNYQALPDVFSDIFRCAFMGHAPLGGFVGAGIMATLHYGVARAVYSGDIAIGYDSIVQSETKINKPELQAKLAIFGQLTDTIICTITLLIVLTTKVWTLSDINNPSEVIVKALLSSQIPYIEAFMTILFFMAGYTTILSYFSVGMKSSSFISKKWGKKIYIIYAIIAFISTKFFDQSHLIMLMSLSGGILVLLNISGIWKLRKEIKFK